MLRCSTHLISVTQQKSHHFNKKSLSQHFHWMLHTWGVGSCLDVTHIVIFCCKMRLHSVSVAMEIVLTELPSWYFSNCVKYSFHGDSWNLLPKHKLKCCAILSFMSSNTYQKFRVTKHKMRIWQDIIMYNSRYVELISQKNTPKLGFYVTFINNKIKILKSYI